MTTKKDDLKRYHVYYFTGDYYSSEGEKRHHCIVSAHSELEAEYIWKCNHRGMDAEFGWAEEVVKNVKPVD